MTMTATAGNRCPRQRLRRPGYEAKARNGEGGHQPESQSVTPQRFVIVAFTTRNDGAEGEGIFETHHQGEITQQAGEIGNEDEECPAPSRMMETSGVLYFGCTWPKHLKNRLSFAIAYSSQLVHHAAGKPTKNDNHRRDGNKDPSGAAECDPGQGVGNRRFRIGEFVEGHQAGNHQRQPGVEHQNQQAGDRSARSWHGFSIHSPVI